MDLITEIKAAIVETQLVSLKARKEHARRFTYNRDLQQEADMLRAQITALEKLVCGLFRTYKGEV